MSFSPQENIQAPDPFYSLQTGSYGENDIGDNLPGEGAQRYGSFIYIKRESFLLGLYKAFLQEVSQAFDVLQGELPGLDF